MAKLYRSPDGSRPPVLAAAPPDPGWEEIAAVHLQAPGKPTRACDGKPVTNGVATGLASCVTCPACLATLPDAPPAVTPAPE